MIKSRQDKFIESRTVIEMEVNKFFNSLQTIDNDIKLKCNVQDGRNAKNTLPSLWEEPFNIDKYNQERASFDSYVAQVRNICDQMNQEALQCLQS